MKYLVFLSTYQQNDTVYYLCLSQADTLPILKYLRLIFKINIADNLWFLVT